MNYICSKQGKIDKLWGRFIKHLLELEAAGMGAGPERVVVEKTVVERIEPRDRK